MNKKELWIKMKEPVPECSNCLFRGSGHMGTMCFSCSIFWKGVENLRPTDILKGEPESNWKWDGETK